MSKPRIAYSFNRGYTWKNLHESISGGEFDTDQRIMLPVGTTLIAGKPPATAVTAWVAYARPIDALLSPGQPPLFFDRVEIDPHMSGVHPSSGTVKGKTWQTAQRVPCALALQRFLFACVDRMDKDKLSLFETEALHEWSAWLKGDASSDGLPQARRNLAAAPRSALGEVLYQALLGDPAAATWCVVGGLKMSNPGAFSAEIVNKLGVLLIPYLDGIL